MKILTLKIKNRNKILSIPELLEHLEKNPFNEDAVQLDGSTFKKSNISPAVHFRYSCGGNSYIFHLNGDTHTTAIKKFIKLHKKHSQSSLTLSTTKAGTPCLRLKGDKKIKGWYCYGRVEKTPMSSNLKAA